MPTRAALPKMIPAVTLLTCQNFFVPELLSCHEHRSFQLSPTGTGAASQRPRGVGGAQGAAMAPARMRDQAGFRGADRARRLSVHAGRRGERPDSHPLYPGGEFARLPQELF